MKRNAQFLVAAFACGLVTAPLMARTCNGNSDLQGTYGFISAPIFPGAPVMPPGTPGVPVTPPGTTGSVNLASPISAFVQNSLQNVPFAVVGTIMADGGGNLVAPATSSSGFLNVGSYTVNTDCTVNLTLQDAYNTQTSNASGTSVSTTASVPLIGLLSDSGAHVVLKPTGNTNAAPAYLTLTRIPPACTDASISGTYSLQASGFWTNGAPPSSGDNGNGSANPGEGSPGTPGDNTPGGGSQTPGNPSSTSGINGVNNTFTLLGRLSADGAGNFVQDALGLASPLPDLQLSGSYRVNPDCSGTGTLQSPDGTSHAINFLLVTPSGSTTPQLQLIFAESGLTGSGTASLQ
jgi:hypothetical protein